MDDTLHQGILSGKCWYGMYAQESWWRDGRDIPILSQVWRSHLMAKVYWVDHGISKSYSGCFFAQFSWNWDGKFTDSRHGGSLSPHWPHSESITVCSSSSLSSTLLTRKLSFLRSTSWPSLFLLMVNGLPLAQGIEQWGSGMHLTLNCTVSCTVLGRFLLLISALLGIF